MDKSIYDIEIQSISGESLDLKTFKGKYLLIVNTASECGLTPQYAQLQQLFENFSNTINILGCPCNDFGNQEPGSLKEINAFCALNYGVAFQMTEKVGILQNMHPLYNWLCNKDFNNVGDFEVEWNFHKFLIDQNGNLIASIAASVDPLSEDILQHLK